MYNQFIPHLFLFSKLFSAYTFGFIPRTRIPMYWNIWPWVKTYSTIWLGGYSHPIYPIYCDVRCQGFDPLPYWTQFFSEFLGQRCWGLTLQEEIPCLGSCADISSLFGGWNMVMTQHSGKQLVGGLEQGVYFSIYMYIYIYIIYIYIHIYIYICI